ncbi:MAG: isoprenylcysteine carboxylmethyltransferase family protein [Desulfobacterium sp.]|nr:isoprenylcysteine carboxylmethyltransferase family protein [Desulfobacterium sp.]
MKLTPVLETKSAPFPVGLLSFLVRHRIGFSKLLGGMVFLVLLFSGSWWHQQHPLVGQLMFLAGAALSGIGAFGRIWCSVYIGGFKNEKLISQGPFSMCRNPLYFFSLVGALGVGLATETLAVPFLILLFFSLYYPYVIKKEEVMLFRKHSKAYAAYIEKVPAFIPRLTALSEPETYLIHPGILRKSLLEAIWFIWFCALFSLMVRLHGSGALPEWNMLF